MRFRGRRMPPRYIRNMPGGQITSQDIGCVLYMFVILIWLFVLASFGITEVSAYSWGIPTQSTEINVFGWIWLGFCPLFPIIPVIIFLLYTNFNNDKSATNPQEDNVQDNASQNNFDKFKIVKIEWGHVTVHTYIIFDGKPMTVKELIDLQGLGCLNWPEVQRIMRDYAVKHRLYIIRYRPEEDKHYYHKNNNKKLNLNIQEETSRDYPSKIYEIEWGHVTLHSQIIFNGKPMTVKELIKFQGLDNLSWPEVQGIMKDYVLKHKLRIVSYRPK